MKKKMILLFCSFVLALAMAGCGNSANPGSDGQEDATVGETDAEDLLTDESSDGQDENSDGQEAYGQTSRPALELGTQYIWEGDAQKDQTYASGYYHSLRLSEKSQADYPELSSALDQYMTNFTSSVKKEIEEYSASFKEDPSMLEYSPKGYVTEDNYYVRRADRSVLSILSFNYTYSGGVHGYYGFGSLNLDASTGQSLTLADVIADTDLLGQRIKEELLAKYGKDTFFDEMEETIDQEISGDADYELTWSLDPQGISFYFNPYEIGPYASGVQTVILLYDKETGLFTDNYRPEKGGYICGMPSGPDCYLDVDGDNEPDRLRILCSQDEESESITGITVEIDDQKLTFEDFECYEIEPKVVFASNGKVYLYLWRKMDNDYVSMHVFDLSDGIPISIGNMNLAEVYHYSEEEGADFSAYKDVLTDPSNMVLSSRFDLMSTYEAGKTYQVRNTPNPVSDEKYYTILRELTLVSKEEITADLVDESGNVTESSVGIPSGTSFKLYRTDGKAIVDALLDDGTIVRFNVTGSYPQTVNGVDAEEVFQ
ncbi:MAG: DUF3298 domain-containing protein, partial [Eubacterium sp.]|nr:DUF3298 domain-containing protein [Eubacterium sp.]